VASFDERVGLGEVDDGAQTFQFHCTQIAGGTRRIAPGTAVVFCTVPARHGRWEAVDMRPIGPGGPAE
jgi:cold shock CspA family protein